MMKLGLSSYSICSYFRSGEKTIFQGMELIKEMGYEHMELVPFGITLLDPESFEIDLPFVKAIAEKSRQLELPLSAFSLNADLLMQDACEQQRELLRVKRNVDMAALLGVDSMRFDMASFRHPYECSSAADLAKDLPQLVKNAREVIDYGESKGLTMTMENHGFYLNGAERVAQIFEAVDRPNYKQTLDVGNFLCVDENPLTEVVKCIKQAHTIHLKDFYIRRADTPQDKALANSASGRKGWITSHSGKYRILGSIIGLGDLDLYDIIQTIKQSGFSGNISIEFEGLEEPIAASRMCRENALALWQSDSE